MSMEVSPASKPTPVLLAAQVAKSKHQPNQYSSVHVRSSFATVATKPSQETSSQSDNTIFPAVEEYKQPFQVGGREERTNQMGTDTDALSITSPAQVPPTTWATQSLDARLPSDTVRKDRGAGNAGEGIVKETLLEEQITELWSSQERKHNSLRRSRAELTTLRNSLAERLHELKHLLARTGRSGKWAEFLRRENIPRATANRYVEKWKQLLDPKPDKRLTEPFPTPSKEEITQMVKKLKLRLEHRLTTPDSVALFMAELAAALQPPVSGA